MDFNYADYCEYLLKYNTNYTITNLGDRLEKITYDATINHYLITESLNSQDFWQNIREEIVPDTAAYLIFDYLVINKKSGDKIGRRTPIKNPRVRRKCSRKKYKVIGEVEAVNCIYLNPQTEQLWMIDYRIDYYSKDNKKNKIDYIEEMIIDVVVKKLLPVKTVLIGKWETPWNIGLSWRAIERLMRLIDNLGKVYYCPLNSSNLVDDTGGIVKPKNLQELTWNKNEKSSGKIIQIRDFPKDKKLKLLWAPISPNRTEYIVTNDVSQSSVDAVKFATQTRPKTEEFHRENQIWWWISNPVRCFLALIMIIWWSCIHLLYGDEPWK
ncbi:MAG: hypothetical protein SWX82_13295 [Cyanobacteriota bacterium]|nr:hypothetical protein [Cyanobacteriota bacterium]